MESLDDLLAELTSGDDRRAEAAVKQIAARGGEAVPYLKELLASPQADTRWWATWALAEIRDPQVPPLLAAALHDPEISVRQAAVLALRVQPDPAAIPQLIIIIETAGLPKNGADPVLTNLAAAALIATGPDAVPALIGLLEAGPQAVRPTAARCLALIGDARAIPALYAALEHNTGPGASALLEHWAAEGLERMEAGMAFWKIK